MKLLQVVPVIESFPSFTDLAREYNFNKDDLILTNRYIYYPLIESSRVECRAVFQEEYGSGEPSDTMVNGILAEAHKKPFARVIAIGGGSIMDIAKIICVADGEDDVNRLYDRVSKLKSAHELFALPTTCGTGSEVTNIAIVNRTNLGTKQGLVSDVMYPAHAILIGEFMQTLPYPVFATSSIDALIHAVESYLSPLATPLTTVFSIAAIRDILDAYQKIADKKATVSDLSDQLLRAANEAGIAFGNAGCGTVHAMSYALGGKYHVPHGESNYQFFLPVLRLYRERNPLGSFAGLEQLLGECLGSDDGLSALEALLERILPHKPMSAYGAVPEDLDPFTDSTIANQQRLLGRTYVPLSREDLYNIFRDCL